MAEASSSFSLGSPTGGSGRSSFKGRRNHSTELSFSISDDSSDKSFRMVAARSSSSMRSSDDSLLSKNDARALYPKGKELRSQRILAEFSINKLQFRHLEMHGRTREIKILQEALEQVHSIKQNQQEVADTVSLSPSPSNSSRQFITIAGTSGTGKTALAATLQKTVQQKTRGLYVQAKWDVFLRDEPYAGIALACESTCHAIQQLASSPTSSSSSSSEERQQQESTTGASKKQQEQAHQNELFYQQIRATLIEELATELPLLAKFIPSLWTAVGKSAKEEQPEVSATPSAIHITNDQAEAKNQFSFAFLRFLRVICKYFTLCLVLDDLQWCDAATKDLLQAIFNDDQNPRWLIVGTFRSNEVDKEKDEYKWLFEAQKQQESASRKKGNQEFYSVFERAIYKSIHLEIGNLQQEYVSLVIQDLLSTSSSPELEEFARVCFQKTHGNVFFVLQFLSILQESQLLRYEMGLMKWIWKLKDVEESVRASDNVLDLLKRKMSTELDGPSKLVLQVAACLGSRFDSEYLWIIWKNRDQFANRNGFDKDASDDFDRRWLNQTLLQLENDGYFDKRSTGDKDENTEFAWVHDNLQEASFEMIPEAEKVTFRRQAGEILTCHLDEAQTLELIFVIVNLLNNTMYNQHTLMIPEEDDDAIIAEAHLNLLAAKKAMDLLAFESTSRYAKFGMQLVNHACPTENKWKQHYTLCLDLLNLGIEAGGYLGNAEAVDSYWDEISHLDPRICPLEDRFRICNAYVDSLGGRFMSEKALQVILDSLQPFGVTFPRNKAVIGVRTVAKISREVAKAKFGLLKLREIKQMADDNQRQVMKLLDKMFRIAYYLKNDLMVLAMFKSVEMSRRYGLTPFSAVCYSQLAVVLSGVLHDYSAGEAFGCLSLELLDQSSTLATESQLAFQLHVAVFSWTRPIRSVLNPLLRGYRKGMQAGDTENAIWCIYHWLFERLMVCDQLESMAADCREYSRQMKHMNRLHAYALTCYMWQALLNLMTVSENGKRSDDAHLKLYGHVLHESEFDEFQQDEWVNHLSRFYETFLHIHFGVFDKLADIALELGHDSIDKFAPGGPKWMLDCFGKGLACLIRARETGKRSYKAMGKLCRSTIQSWVRRGNPNVVHYLSLLDGEWFALEGKRTRAIAYMTDANGTALRNGYIGDAALAYERLGVYYLRDLSDEEEGQYYLKEALKKYTEWGAMGKVQRMKQQFPFLQTAV